MKQRMEKNFVNSYDEVEMHFQQPVLEFLVEGEWSSEGGKNILERIQVLERADFCCGQDFGGWRIKE